MSLIHKYNNNTRFKQVLSLFSVNLIGLPLGVLTSIVVTNYLGSKGYGDYRLVLSIFNIASVVFTFGFYQAGNRALVLNKNPQTAKEYYGAELLITAGLFVLMSLGILCYAIFDTNIQEKHLSHFLIFAIPFGWIFLLQKYSETLFQADNRIRLLAETRLNPQILLLLTASLVCFSVKSESLDKLSVIWACYVLTQIIVYGLTLHKLNISYNNIRSRVSEIWRHNKSFGSNIYFGSLFAVGFAQLSVIFISYNGIDNSGVGFYSLALTLSAPLAFIPNTVATAHYQDFAVQKYIPKKLFIVTLVLSISALIALWAIVGPFVNFFYGKSFSQVAFLTYIVSIGIVLNGMGDFFNRYFGANGQAIVLRNTSFLVGTSILIGNIVLVPLWGVYGASYTNIISGFIYLFVMILSYLKYIKNNL